MTRIIANLRWKKTRGRFLKAAEKAIAVVIFDIVAEDFPDADARHAAYQRRVDCAVARVFREHTEFDVRTY